MYRVLVVDDEQWVRRGLIHRIPWEGLGLELAGEAGDGETALSLALERKPHIALVDMRMPGWDGRELLRRFHSLLPDLVTVVLSGYSDFEYTQAAIRWNAFDYLLKPVKDVELQMVLRRAVAEAERRTSARASRGARVLELLADLGARSDGTGETEMEGPSGGSLLGDPGAPADAAPTDAPPEGSAHGPPSGLPGGLPGRSSGVWPRGAQGVSPCGSPGGPKGVAWSVVVLRRDRGRDGEDDGRDGEGEARENAASLAKAFDDALSDAARGAAARVRWAVGPEPAGGREVVGLFEHAPGAESDLRSLLERALKALGRGGILASAGVSPPVTEPKLLNDAYAEARRLVDSKLLSQAGALLTHGPVEGGREGEASAGGPRAGGTHGEEAPGAAQETGAAGKGPRGGGARGHGTYPAVEEHRFLTALRSGDAESARAALNDFFKALSPERTTVGWLRRVAETLVYSVERLLVSRRTDMATLTQVAPDALCERLRRLVDAKAMSEELERAWLPALADYFRSPKELDGSAVIAEVVRAIEEEYYLPLSLQGLADRFGLHPDYLSRLFKKETGKNFIDYLTDLRIRKSRELIRESRYKNYEIAAMVGYDDYRYFSQVFKKKCGMTINEYRARHGGQGTPGV